MDVAPGRLPCNVLPQVRQGPGSNDQRFGRLNSLIARGLIPNPRRVDSYVTCISSSELSWVIFAFSSSRRRICRSMIQMVRTVWR